VWDGGRSVSGVGGMPRVAQNLLGGGTMEGGETSDKVFGFTRNGVPVRPLKVDFRVSILLDKGLGVVGTKRGVTTEENVRDNGCAERESNEPAFRSCMRVEAIILVNQMSMGFPWPVFLMTSGTT